MPYYDGQSSGNEWVKTDSGWKKLVALRENLHRHIKTIALERLHSYYKSESTGEDTTQQNEQITRGALQITGEDVHEYYQNIDKSQTAFVAIPRSSGAGGIYFTIGEVISKLHFGSAVGDHRRYNYVCRFLELISTTRFSSLSGLAQMNLFYIIEEAVNVVLKTHQNIAQMKRILNAAIVSMNKSRINHIGCAATWKARAKMLDNFSHKIHSINVKERNEDGTLLLEDIPDEILQRIFNHLSDHRDIIHAGETCYRFNGIANRGPLWRDLCNFHFTEYQIGKVQTAESQAQIDWRNVYKKMYRRHPVQEEYTDIVQICAYCNSLYWMNGGHPCPKELLKEGNTSLKERPELALNISLAPQQFLDLFPAPH